ncbi:MAG TPA: hypothetical protein VK066_28085 [Chloroflexota bacterium]|nr:hypothetical protein [Chloroflexota bacterium]
MEEVAGVAGVPLIVGLVEVAKGVGLDARWAPAVALGLGLALSLGYRAALGGVGGAEWAQATLGGLALGLAASGLYSGTRAVANAAR